MNVVIKYTGLSPYENSQKYLFYRSFTTETPPARVAFLFLLVDHQDNAEHCFRGGAEEKGSHFPLEDRQARLSDAECGNIDARRQNP